MSNVKKKTGAYIYDASDEPILGFNVFSVEEEAPARIIGAPVETGQVSFDNKVIDPKIVTVKGTIVIGSDSDKVFDDIQKMIDSREFKFYKVCDGNKWYSNLILENKKLSRGVGRFDFNDVTLRYKEAMFVQIYQKTPANPQNTDTRNNGYQQGVSK